jgi:indole-3-glycerol phosphate synthase
LREGSVFLNDLAHVLRQEVSERKRKVQLSALQERPHYQNSRRGFLRALREKKGRRIVAELKRSSPSRGLIRKEFDPETIAVSYESHGAVALSVVTQQRFFGGEPGHLERVRERTHLPLLMKDFLLDAFQLHEARSHGADAVLLIVAMLEDGELQDLRGTARELGLDTLIEVHSESELERALKLHPDLVGVNNRDLKDLSVDLGTTERLLPCIPDGVFVVSESGFRSGRDLIRLEQRGVHAFLIGEWLMEGSDPGARLEELLQW